MSAGWMPLTSGNASGDTLFCHHGDEALLCECLSAPVDAKANYLMLHDMRLILCRWHNEKDWNALIRNGMTSDLSWDSAAKDYEQIFSWALMDPPQA